MKTNKLLFSALAALAIVGCQKPQTPMDFVLADSMIEVSGLTEDPLIQVNNADKTVYIEIAYIDKAEIAALRVKFNLPEGVTADPAESSFNYASATQKVVFTQYGQTVEYEISAAVTAPDPHFTSLKLNGREVSGGSVKLLGSTKLDKVAVEFTVAPEGTEVLVGGSPLVADEEDGSFYVDFSDKVNGVTFSLVCGSVTNEENVKVVTTGINSLVRVWGHYFKPTSVTDDFFGTEVDGGMDAIRWMAMDNKYVYLSSKGTKLIYAIDLMTGKKAKELSMAGYSAGGVFGLAGLSVMNNGASSVLLSCNMINAVGSILKVYKWDSVDSDPELVLEFKPADAGISDAIRLGDMMTTEGDWNEGKIWFADYSQKDRLFYFPVKNGQVDKTPVIVKSNENLAVGNNISGIYKYQDNKYVWGGTGDYVKVFTLEGTSATVTLKFDNGNSYSHPLHGARFFSFNEQNYMSYLLLRNGYQDAQLRINELNDATLEESLQNLSVAARANLGDPTDVDITAVKNGNGCGASDLRIVDGKIYIAAFAPGSGVSVFTIE